MTQVRTTGILLTIPFYFQAPSLGLVGFGPKESEANKREFSEEQLREGKSIISLQYGTNKGANQSGLNFGKTRSILD
jgi:hypothetical protein